MKKLLTIAAGFALAFQCFATGPIPINSPQTGTLNFVTNGASPLVITNQFVVGYTYPPVMQFFLISGVTNALPLTNTIVTTTNFAVSLATPTNCTIAWSAFAGYPRFQFGTNITLAAVSTNIAFPTPYAQVPTVEIQELTTNATMSVTAVTTTNFTVLANTAAAFLWDSIGIAYTPGTATLTY